MGKSGKIYISLLAFSFALAGPLFASSIYNADTIGIQNSDLPEEGSKTFGPENNQQSSIRKIEQALEDTRREIADQICDQAPTDQLCSTLPKDNTDFSELFVYLFISAAAQNSFDIFSWQSFVGLNWPTESDGHPISQSIGEAPGRPRTWLSYPTPRELFSKGNSSGVCADLADFDYAKPHLLTDVFLQTGGQPLIDKNRNYVVYDIRINPVLADYLLINNLTSKLGQQAFLDSGQEIDYPVGYYRDPIKKSEGEIGSIAIKTAWKIIDANDDPTQYYTLDGLIQVAAADSVTGEAFCLRERLALIGMHIMSRTDSGNGRNWTWATFEHVDNAPLAANSRRPADILHETPFAEGCQPPGKLEQQYALFDSACPACKTNHIESAQWKWADSKPYARTNVGGRTMNTQVVRCWKVFEGTQTINEVWQSKLEQTVWANYRLLSAQWKGGNRGLMFPQGEVPRFLTNPVLETYDQYSPTSSCLSCHATARSLSGQDAKFSFLLGLFAKYAAE